MMDKSKVTKDYDNRQLIVERTFDAPRARVWAAYTEKDKFEQWWGPRGWTTTVKEFDFTAGGRNLYCMKCEDENQTDWFGQESWGLMVFDAITAPETFAYEDYFSDENGTINKDMPATSTVMEFSESEGKTLMKFTSTVVSKEALEKLIDMGMVEGMNSTLDRLDDYLAK